MKIIIWAVPLLVLMIILIFYITKGGTTSSANYDKLFLKEKNQTCKLQGVILKTYADNDFGKGQGDLYPDSCDVCLGGDDATDRNGDGMPDACDKFPPTEMPPRGAKMSDVCKGTWNDKTQQCVLPCYTAYMTGKSPTPCPRA